MNIYLNDVYLGFHIIIKIVPNYDSKHHYFEFLIAA